MKFRQVLLLLLFMNSVLFAQSYFMMVKLRDGTSAMYDLNTIKRIEIDTVTAIEDLKKMNQIVRTFNLNQNYPNPFNPSTTIAFSIPRAGRVAVKIYDMRGRLITALEDQYSKAGHYKKIWNGKDQRGNRVASGFYIYTVFYEDKMYSKKMLLIK